MGYENKAGTQVNNYYGARETGFGLGVEQSSDSVFRLRIDLTGAQLSQTTPFIPPVVIPKGAKFQSAILRVDEVFVVTGTTPTVIIGAAGTEATNGIVLSEAELEAVGTKAPASTGTGTWSFSSATGTTAAAKVGIVKGGTTPAVAATQGKATLVLEFVNLAKA